MGETIILILKLIYMNENEKEMFTVTEQTALVVPIGELIVSPSANPVGE
jgi:hypothetical protein